jgi:AGZA family xanthine/uracil permease-like MFS transporter
MAVPSPACTQCAFLLHANAETLKPHGILAACSITFISLGQMAGVLNKKGDMPRSNIAFLADAFGTTLGGLLGSSALTTYVESASAMREGGRTGFTAVVCSLFFLASIALW